MVLVVRYLAARRAGRLAAAIAGALGKARRLHDTGLERAEAHYQQELERIRGEFEDTTQTVDQQLKQALAEAGERRVACRMESDEKASRALEKNDRLHRAKLDRLRRQHVGDARTVEANGGDAPEGGGGGQREEGGAAQRGLPGRVAEAGGRVEERDGSRFTRASSPRSALAAKLFPPWEPALLESWAPPTEFAAAAKFAQIGGGGREARGDDAQGQAAGVAGAGPILGAALPGLPGAGLDPVRDGTSQGHDEAIGALNNIILRLLSTAPPGRLNFTILDPVGLGQNFAGIMHLADYEEQIINSRIWTQSGQIEQKLARPERAHGEGHPDVSAQRVCRPSRNTTSRRA